MNHPYETLPKSWEKILAHWLDTRFQIPGTNIRFGLDGLIGLIPGVGDAATNVLSLFIIGSAAQQGVPVSILLRMLLTVVIDAFIGAIPILGDFFDLFYKANLRNLKLLERYRLSPDQTAKGSLVWVVFVVLLAFVMVFAIVALVGTLIFYLVEELSAYA